MSTLVNCQFEKCKNQTAPRGFCRRCFKVGNQKFAKEKAIAEEKNSFALNFCECGFEGSNGMCVPCFDVWRNNGEQCFNKGCDKPTTMIDHCRKCHDIEEKCKCVAFFAVGTNFRGRVICDKCSDHKCETCEKIGIYAIQKNEKDENVMMCYDCAYVINHPLKSAAGKGATNVANAVSGAYSYVPSYNSITDGISYAKSCIPNSVSLEIRFKSEN